MLGLGLQQKLCSPIKPGDMLHLQSKLRTQSHMTAFHAVFALQDRGIAGLPCGILGIVEAKRHRPAQLELILTVISGFTDRLN